MLIDSCPRVGGQGLAVPRIAMSGGLLSASSFDSEQDTGHCTLLTESSSEADGRGEGPQGIPLSLEERKKHRAEVARRAKAAKAAKGARPLPAPFADPAHTAPPPAQHNGIALARRAAELRREAYRDEDEAAAVSLSPASIL